MEYFVKKEFAGKGLVISLRRTMFKMIRIDLDKADQTQLKFIHDAKLPYVSSRKIKEAKPA